MKFELRAQRIAERVSCPELEEALLKGQADLIPKGQCLHWPGAKTKSGIVKKIVRDYNGRPGISAVDTSPFPRITIKKDSVYLHRFVFEKTRGLPSNAKLMDFCGDTLCINPWHWKVFIPNEKDFGDIEEAPEFTDEWSLADAVELLDIYLTTNDKVDRDHDLLVDMPEEFLVAALVELKKEHLL